MVAEIFKTNYKINISYERNKKIFCKIIELENNYGAHIIIRCLWCSKKEGVYVWDVKGRSITIFFRLIQL